MTKAPRKSARAAPTGDERARRRLSPDARRNELINAGKEVIRLKGVDARVEDVTTAAGAAKGTFYVYFSTWTDFVQEVRSQVDELVAERFVDLTKDYRDWRSVFLAFSKLHLKLVRELNGLENVYYIPVGAGTRDVNLERTIDFLAAAQRAGAIEIDDPEVAGRLVFRMVIYTTEAIVAGREDERACDVCGEFIVAGLRARPLPRFERDGAGDGAETASVRKTRRRSS